VYHDARFRESKVSLRLHKLKIKPPMTSQTNISARVTTSLYGTVTMFLTPTNGLYLYLFPMPLTYIIYLAQAVTSQ